MKKLLALLLFLAAISVRAQNVLPNISYNGLLTSSCSTPNGACTNAVFVTTLGISGSPQPSGSGSTLDVPVQNYAAATVTISGTYAGVTIGFDFSDPTAGTNYFQEVCARTDVNILEASEVVPTNQIRAWQCPVWAAMRFRVRASAYGSGAANINITLTQAAIDPSLIVAAAPPVIPGSTDSCQDLSQIKSTAVINIASATTTELVPAVAGKTVYVCGFSATIQGSATTVGAVVFKTGTKVSTACDTSPASLTGTFQGNISPNVPLLITGQGSMTQFAGAVAGEICATTTGTTVAVGGYLTFVQQ
jgi:hypothetical protein